MPFAGFKCPAEGCGLELSREEALQHLPNEHGGVVPAAVIEAIWRAEESPRRQGVHFSPSMPGGCMREYAISRTYNTYVDPWATWKMLEGSLWHEVMQKYNAPGWLAEVRLPLDYIDNLLASQGGAKAWKNGNNINSNLLVLPTGNFRCIEDTWEYELFPGMWFSMVIDSVKGDYSEIIDYKSKASPLGWKDKATGEIRYGRLDWPVDWTYQLQLNLYALTVFRLYGTMPKPFIWDLYKGIQLAPLAWHRKDVPLIDEAQLEREVRPDYEMFRKVMEVPEDERPQAIGQMPLQGLGMYGGKKCDLYCGVNMICKSLSGWDQKEEI